MELYDNEVEQKRTKLPMILIILIIVLTLITVGVVFGIMYLKNSITTVEVNGQKNLDVANMIYLDKTGEGTQLYFPILRMAKYLGYEGYNGDYKNKSEDKTKCHVTCENETAMFTLNSDSLLKISKNSEYEYITLDKPVFEKNGELYTTKEGIEKAFNVAFSSNDKYTNIKIYTMEFLINYYATNQKQEKYSKVFANEKAILEGMLVIEDSNKKLGVINANTGKFVLESKYDDITYLPTTKEFLIKSNGKYGVIATDQSVIINAVYDEIKTMDNQIGLYLVKQNNAYGVLNTKGRVIIDIVYSQIGIDNSKYTQNGVENKYILLNEIIPIKNSKNLWAFYNINGKQLTEFKYTNVGCQLTPVSNSYPAVVIPSYKVIVVEINKKYNLVNFAEGKQGEELVPENVLDAVYLRTDSTTGQNKFFMTTNDNTKVRSIEDWLASIGQ